MPWGNMSWGSVQYDAAHDFYAALMADETLIEKSGIEINFERIRSFEDVQSYMVLELVEMADEREGDGELEEWDQELLNEVTLATTGDGLFVALRNASWDLWGAAPFIAGLFFEDLKIAAVPVPDDVRGPVLNQMVQLENNETGLFCYLLKKHGLVNDEESFSGFDT